MEPQAEAPVPETPKDELIIDIGCYEERIKLRDGQQTVKEYILREMNGAQRDEYQNLVVTRGRFNSKGEPVGVSKYDDLQATLISKCLFDPNTGKNVPVSVIQKWGSLAQATLFKKCQVMCGLSDEAEEQAKKRLIGEEGVWFEIARELNMSVARAKCETTSSQFVAWRVKLREAWNKPDRRDNYLAQIAYEIHLLRVSWTGCRQKDFDEFLIKFEQKERVSEDEPVEYMFSQVEEFFFNQQQEPEKTEEEKQELARKSALSKAFWFALAGGFTPGGQIKTQQPPNQAPVKVQPKQPPKKGK